MKKQRKNISATPASGFIAFLTGWLLVILLAGFIYPTSAAPQSNEDYLVEQSLNFCIDFFSKGFSSRPDPEKAAYLMGIVNRRVDTINSGWGTAIQTFPVDFWNSYKGGRLKDRAIQLNSKEVYGKELAELAWDLRAGACEEHATIMAVLLEAAKVNNVRVFRTTAPHAFPVVGAAPDADPDNPWTWGPSVYVPDSWSNKILRGPQEIWDNSYTFGGGKYSCAVPSKGSANCTREKMKAFVDRGTDFIKRHCNEYKPLLEKFMKYPEQIRNQMPFKPPEGVCGCSSSASPSPSPSSSLSPSPNRAYYMIAAPSGNDAGSCKSDEVPDDIVANTGEVKVFRVPPGQWVSTGIQLKQGQPFQITATGKLTRPGDREWGPGGYYHLGFMAFTFKAMVGDKLFEIGGSGGGAAPVDGELRLGISYTYEKINPADSKLQGAFTATVTIDGKR